MTKTKLSKSAGRFGPRYGVSVRRRIASIEGIQKKKQKCIFCNGRAKRLSKGIWLCNKCGKKFAGHAYYLLKEDNSNAYIKEEQNSLKTKPLKKEIASNELADTSKKSTKKTKSKNK